MQDSGVPWLPTQPYSCLPRMHPGEKLLMRMVSAGRDLHPFHHHANHALAIARDGRVLSSNPGDPTLPPDLATLDFTVNAVPSQTMDLIFEWTGKNLGWDVYGHAPPAGKGEFLEGRRESALGDVVQGVDAVEGGRHTRLREHADALEEAEADVELGIGHAQGSQLAAQLGREKCCPDGDRLRAARGRRPRHGAVAQVGAPTCRSWSRSRGGGYDVGDPAAADDYGDAEVGGRLDDAEQTSAPLSVVPGQKDGQQPW
jgi:hypothetical protein